MNNIFLITIVISLLFSCTSKIDFTSDKISFELIQEVDLKNSKAGFEDIKSISLSEDGESIIVADGSIIRGSSDLTVLSSDDFTVEGLFSVSRQMSNNYPWSSGSHVVFDSNSKVLLYNQVIDLESFKSVKALYLNNVLNRPNATPEPLSISPDGSLALVIVDSYFDSAESCLALFDLNTGKVIKKLSSGKNVANGNARFINNDEILVWNYDGALISFNIKKNTKAIYQFKGPSPPFLPYENKQNAILIYDDVKRAVLCGSKTIQIIDLENMTIIESYKSFGSNAVKLDPQYFMWLGSNDKKEAAFKITDIYSGKVVNEIESPEGYYNQFLVNVEKGFLFALRYTQLFKFRIKFDSI